MEPMITTLSIAFKGITTTVALLKWIETNINPFTSAFNSTVAAFEEDIPNIRQQLADFFCIDGIQTALYKLLVNNEVVSDLLIQQFIVEADIYYSEQEEAEIKARGVIESFLKELNYHMLRSKDQTYYLDQRQEQRQLQVIEEIRGISNQLGELGLSTSTDRLVEFCVNSKLEELWGNEINKYKTLTEENGPKEALSYWNSLYNTVTSYGTKNSDLLFEICTNLGSCYWKLHMENDARRMFLEAYRQKPLDNRAKLNRALVYFIDKKEGLAFDLVNEVLDDNQNDPKVLAVKAYFLVCQGQYPSIVSMFENHMNNIGELIIENSDCCRVLAMALIETSNYSRAKKVIQQGLRIEPDNPYNKVVLGICFLKQNSQKVCCKSYEEYSELQKAEQMFGEALAYFELNDMKSALVGALVNRTTARLRLENSEGALNDAERAFHLDDSSAEVIKNLVLANWHFPDKRKKVLETLEEWIKNDRDPQNEAFLLVSYLQDDPESALWRSNKFINNRYPAQPYTDLPDHVLSIMAQTLTACKEYDQAEVVLEELENRRPDSLIQILRARIIFDKGDKEGAAIKLDLAWQMAVDMDDELSKADVVGLYYSFKDWDRVIQLSKEMGVNEYSPRPILENYILSMYRSEEPKYEDRILNLCTKFDEERGYSATLTQARIFVHELRGDFQKSHPLWGKLVDNDPEEYRHQLGLARCVWSLTQDKENVLDIIRKIPKSKIADPLALMRIAGIYVLCEAYETALELAYEGWRRGRPNHQINLAYISLFLEISQRTELDLDCNRVQEGTAVTLEFRDGDKKILVITKPGDLLQSEEKEIDENVTNELLGKQKGEKIQWGIESTLIDIRHKYVWALHTAMEVHPIWYPNDLAFRSFNTELDKDKIREFMDNDYKRIQEIISYYQSEPMPVAILGKLLGRNPIDLWGSIVSSHNQELSINFSRNTLIERNRELSTLSSAEIVVLDPIAILTLQHLGVTRYLGRFKSIIVARQLYDSLISSYTELEKYKDAGQQFMGKNDHGYFIDRTSAEQVRSNLDFLKSLILFCENSTNIMGRPRPYSEFEHSIMLDMAWEESIVSIMLAQTTDKAVLYSDDVYLREFAYNEYGVRSFNTWTLLSKELDEGHLSKKQYSQLTIKLMRSNYKQVPINATILTETAIEKMNPQDEVYMMILDQLFSPDTEIISTIRVVSVFLCEFFVKIHLFYYAEPFLEQMLQLLYSHAGIKGIEILLRTLAYINNEKVIPMFTDINKYIEQWKVKYIII